MMWWMTCDYMHMIHTELLAGVEQYKDAVLAALDKVGRYKLAEDRDLVGIDVFCAPEDKDSPGFPDEENAAMHTDILGTYTAMGKMLDAIECVCVDKDFDIMPDKSTSWPHYDGKAGCWTWRSGDGGLVWKWVPGTDKAYSTPMLK